MSIENVSVFFHVFNNNNTNEIVSDILSYFSEELKQKIEFSYSGDELETLNKLHSFSKINTNHKILYIHTKGVVNRNENVDSWRRYMCRYVIGKYKECLSLLNTYDCCGVDYRTDPQPHFSGNFWWVTSEYLNKLIRPEETFSSISPRHRSEFWIGANHPRFYSMNDCGVNVYERHLYNYDNF